MRVNACMRRPSTTLLLVVLTACEGPTALSFAVDDAYLDAGAQIVLCAGSTVVVDVELFSSAGSADDFVVVEHAVEPADVASATLRTAGSQEVHELGITATAPGNASLAVTGQASPSDGADAWLRLVVVECDVNRAADRP